MSTPIVTNQAVSIATGTHDLGPFTIPDSLNGLEILISRDTTATPTFWTDPTCTMSWSIFVSTDGINFTFIFGTGTIAGGVRTGANGEVAFDFIRLTAGTLPSGTSRQMKATCTVVNGPLISQISVNAL